MLDQLCSVAHHCMVVVFGSSLRLLVALAGVWVLGCYELCKAPVSFPQYLTHHVTSAVEINPQLCAYSHK
jgi:hypothetical protein